MDKTGWTKVKLGDICKITIGEFVKKTEQSDDKPYPVWNGGITNTGFYDQYNMDGQYILVSARGANAGYTNKISGKYWAGNSVYSIKVSNNCDYEYVYYAIKYNQPSLIGQQLTGSIPAISKKQVEELTIDLPPMEIQLQIAKLLTTIDNIIQSKSDELTNYQNMKTQLMNDIFANGEREQNWTKVKLGDICNIHDKKRKPVSKTDRVDGEYPYYGANGIQSYIDGYLFDGDYILVGEDGSVITENGNPVVNLAHGKFWANNHVHVIDAKPCVDFNYLYQALQLTDVSVFVHGNIPKLSQGDFKNIELYLPPMEIQLMIANLLTMYDDVIETVNKEKEDYEKIKAQMMNMIFA